MGNFQIYCEFSCVAVFCVYGVVECYIYEYINVICISILYLLVVVQAIILLIC